LAIALALIAAFMCVEFATGVVATSLALLSDAAHMLTDPLRSGSRWSLSDAHNDRRRVR
jgi:Co/Zn/Cd efflux system component